MSITSRVNLQASRARSMISQLAGTKLESRRLEDYATPELCQELGYDNQDSCVRYLRAIKNARPIGGKRGKSFTEQELERLARLFRFWEINPEDPLIEEVNAACNGIKLEYPPTSQRTLLAIYQSQGRA